MTETDLYMADDEDIDNADIETLRAHIRRFNAVLKEFDECKCPRSRCTTAKSRMCRDCLQRIAHGRPLNKPSLKIV